MMMIDIQLNGERTQVPPDLDIVGLLNHLDIHTDRVAIELNRQIVRKPAWDSTRIEPGAEVEIVHFVGGGFR